MTDFNRREFIALLAAGGAGLTFDLDKLLWVPGSKKTFVIGAGYNGFFTMEQITREAMMILEGHLAFARPFAKLHGDGKLDEGQHQVHIQMENPEVREHLEPAMLLLANDLKDHKAKAMGVLENPGSAVESAVVTNPGSNLSLRGVRDYDIYQGRTAVRFDILYGMK